MPIYKHTSRVIGRLHKRYRPTGSSEYYIMVNTIDGRQFYAPESQWKVIKK